MTDPSTQPSDHWSIRRPGPGQLRDFMAHIPAAFGEDIPESDTTDWLQVVEADRWIGAVESAGSGAAVGSTTAYSVRLTVPGGEVGAAAVTGVAVRPDHRRRGILTALMREQLEEVRARGEAVSVLWASEGAIYQRFGYGLATFEGTFEVDTRRTAYERSVAPEGRVRLLTEAEAMSALPPIYEAMRRVTPGALSRSEVFWRHGPISDSETRRRGGGPKYLVVYDGPDGSAEGYAIYRVKDGWDATGPRNSLEVSETVTLTSRALRALWRYLFDTDLVRTVRALRVPVPFPLQLVVAEPRALGLLVKDGLWLRLVDLPAALAGRTYGATDALVVEVSDAFCSWNEGRWHIDARAGAGAAIGVERTDAAPDLLLDTTELAAMYLGGTRATDLAFAGRITEVTPGALLRADALFTGDSAPWCVSMF
jgi:predicted acetyltransferase